MRVCAFLLLLLFRDSVLQEVRLPTCLSDVFFLNVVFKQSPSYVTNGAPKKPSARSKTLALDGATTSGTETDTHVTDAAAPHKKNAEQDPGLRETAVALYDFTAEETNGLTFFKGDIITLTDTKASCSIHC